MKSYLNGERFRLYRELSKSGIVTFVLLSTLCGFLIGFPHETLWPWTKLILTLLGTLFLACGSSALNQIQEIQLDKSMPRTATRPLPSGQISRAAALRFSLISMLVGLFLLGNAQKDACILGALTVLLYNGLYTIWWKKKWAYAAIPGAIPGALPVLMGYAAAADSAWKPAGLYLFLLLFFWQMPHFWVLALRYRHDYRIGGIPTLPVAHGTEVTLNQILLWCLGYVGLGLTAPFFLKVSALYLVITLLMSVQLLLKLRAFLKKPESGEWLRFFLWVNASVMIYLFAASVDLWSYRLLAPIWVR